MAIAVTHATMLNVSVFTCSPIRSRRFTRSRIKMITMGSQIAISYLRKNENLPDRNVRDQNDARADGNQNRVETIKDFRVLEFVVDPGFKSQTFADHMRRRERQNRGRKEGGVQQAKGKRKSRPFPCQRNQGLGGLDRVGNIALAGNVQSGCGGHDDEKHDDHATDAAHQNVGARLRILPRPDFFLDESRLQVKELPRRNGRSHQRRQRQQIAGIEMQGWE